MIFIKLKGRVGNQLFQVAFSYLLSRKSGQNIIVLPISQYGFQLENFKLPIFLNIFSYKFLKILYRLIYLFSKKSYCIHRDSCLINHTVNNIKDINTIVEGYFQDGAIYSTHKEEFQKVFSIKKKITNNFNKKYGNLFKDKVLVINFRLKEYSNFYFEEIDSVPFISSDWYFSILDSLNLMEYGTCVVISDDIYHAKQMLTLYNYSFLYIDDSWIVDFQFLLNGDTLVIPNSSFSWWGAFLNKKNNKLVFAPKNWAGINAGIEYPAGIMIDDFIWV